MTLNSYLLILHYANLLASNPHTAQLPFELIYHHPKGGSAYYTRESQKFVNHIHEMEATHHMDIPPPPDLHQELKKRGRYTHKPFIEALAHIQWIGKRHADTTMKRMNIPITEATVFQQGFAQYYAQLTGDLAC